MTAQDLISSAMRKIGVLASGESIPSADASDALAVLNALLDSWSNQDLLIPNKVRSVNALVAGTASYTLGTAGTWATTRPLKIETALLQIATVSPVLEVPLRILTKDQYAAIPLKANSSTYPTDIYPDYAYPTTTVSVYPVPDNSSNNVVLYSWNALTALAALTTSISLPPGYLRALTYSLALELGPEYGRQPSQLVVDHAIESKADIKRMNFVPSYLQVDDAARAKPSFWNWRTGEPT